MPDIHIVSQITETLSPAMQAAIIDVCVAAHQEEDFRQLFTYAPTGGTHWLATRNETLVSHAVVSTRRLLTDNGLRLKTAYIDAVATLPACQGQGIGSRLMRQLADSLASYDIACLETERTAFYTRLGWQVWRGPLAGRKGGELIPMPQQTGIMILPLARTPPLALDGTLTIEYDGRFW